MSSVTVRASMGSPPSRGTARSHAQYRISEDPAPYPDQSPEVHANRLDSSQIGRPRRTVSQNASCPHDTTPLEPRIVGSAVFLVCPQCAGLWIQKPELDRFLKSPAEAWRLPLHGELSQPSDDDPIHCICRDRSLMRAGRPGRRIERLAHGSGQPVVQAF